LVVREGKAYIGLLDAVELKRLTELYSDWHIPALCNAKITTLPANFDWEALGNDGE
jgi:hypothetical protein